MTDVLSYQVTDGDRVFLEVHSERTRNHNHNLQQEKFQLDAVKTIMRRIQQWNRLNREVVKPLSLYIF